MSDRKNIIHIARNIFKRRHGFYDKSTFHPARDWLFGLFLSLIVIVIGGAQGAYTFLKYQNVTTEGVEYAETVTRYDHSLVQKALTTYTQRQDTYLKLQGEVVVKPVEVVATTTATTTELDISEENGTTTALSEEIETATTSEGVESGE